MVEGKVEHYNGDYTEYHDWKAARARSGSSALRHRLSQTSCQKPDPGVPKRAARLGWDGQGGQVLRSVDA